MARQDILLDDNQNPQVSGGDFATGDSDDQHVELLLMTTPGQWKESPLVGIGLQKNKNKQTTSISQIKREITVGLAADGYKVTTLTMADGDFKLTYELN